MSVRAIVGILLAALSGNAQPLGTFTLTGSMITSRFQHTATLLVTGKVLIAGGLQSSLASSSFLASAELFDPSSGIFRATGNMTTARAGHTATLLADGKVLITGGLAAFDGFGSASTLATAELYDPGTGTFTATGNMVQGRAVHAATLMGNGKVLVAGNGNYRTSAKTYMAELYDPLTQTFSSLGPLSLNATQLTLLPNGNVLVQGADSSGRLSALIYDPNTGAFSPTGPAGIPVFDFPPRNAGLLINGKVLDIDLDDGDDPTNVASIYEPSAGTFAEETMAEVRWNASATTLSDGTVLIAGGGESASFWAVGAATGAEIYDPIADRFSVTGSLAGSRDRHTATLLPDGTVLVAGGWGYFAGTPWGYRAGTLADAEIYHPNVTVPAPVLLSLPGNIQGSGAILHGATQQAVTADSPAVAGEAIEIYGTGLIDRSVIPPQIAIGGTTAEVLWFGKAPGYDRLNQINVRVPSGVAPNDAVPIWMNYLNRPSNEVTLSVRGQ
jgi:hypothetical protein